MLKLYTFEEYAKRLSDAGLLIKKQGEFNGKIEFLCCDSKKAKNNTMFVCKGNHFKAEYLDKAVAAGAVCYVAEKEYTDNIPFIIVSDVRAALAELSDMYYNSPWKELDITAVTGTKGKTTVIHYVKTLLDTHFAKTGQKPCGLVSTVEMFDGVNAEESVNSTPESIDLQKHFLACVDNGLKSVACEVSSQALKYHRVRCTRFKTGVFVNIGVDHISPVEHPDFEDYFASKLKLFSQCENAVINRGTDYYDRVLKEASMCKKITTFG